MSYWDFRQALESALPWWVPLAAAGGVTAGWRIGGWPAHRRRAAAGRPEASNAEMRAAIGAIVTQLRTPAGLTRPQVERLTAALEVLAQPACTRGEVLTALRAVLP